MYNEVQDKKIKEHPLRKKYEKITLITTIPTKTLSFLYLPKRKLKRKRRLWRRIHFQSQHPLAARPCHSIDLPSNRMI